jgi:hypothetical protein
MPSTTRTGTPSSVQSLHAEELAPFWFGDGGLVGHEPSLATLPPRRKLAAEGSTEFPEPRWTGLPSMLVGTPSGPIGPTEGPTWAGVGELIA